MTTSSSKIDQFTAVMRRQGSGEVDGVRIDDYGAAMVVMVYNALDEGRREKFVSLDPLQMKGLAFRILGKTA